MTRHRRELLFPTWATEIIALMLIFFIGFVAGVFLLVLAI